MSKWITKGFEAFRKGKFGNGGQNIYVSKAGVLQRINRTSLFSSGYVDLVFSNAQGHEELVPIDVYPDPLNHPENKRQLYIGGAMDGVVADLGGNGLEDMAWGCVWDGMTLLCPSVIYFNGDDGPSGKYVNYVPATGSNLVAAGDFNGDGRNDLLFYGSKRGLRLVWQDEVGFAPRQMAVIPARTDIASMVGYRFKDDKAATLFIRMEDGSIGMIKDFTSESKDIPLLPADPDYVKVVDRYANAMQAIKESAPKLRVIKIGGTDYLTVFRKKCLLLYPLGAKKIGTKPLCIDVPEGTAVEAGDVFGRGCTDLLISSVNGSDRHETSYLYLGGKDGYSNKRRLTIPTCHACDVALGNFSGGKGLDLVICEKHTLSSYNSHVRIYPTGTLAKPAIPEPVSLVAYNPMRVLVVHDKSGRPYLVVGNNHSGDAIANPDNDIYLGSATGYHEHDKITLPGRGAVDSVIADLNDDGKADIVFANATELAMWMDFGSYVFYQKDGRFQRQPQRLQTFLAHGVQVADLNHNGYLDLVFTCLENHSIAIFHGGPNGYSNDRVTFVELKDEKGNEYRPLWPTLADLNNDGYLDIIIHSNRFEEWFILWGGPDGFDFKRRQTFKTHFPASSKVADLNGNGYPDIIVGAHNPTPGEPNDSYIHIYWGGPEGYSESRMTMLPCSTANSMNVADFNNDGLLDIFVGNYQNVMERDIPSYIYWNSPEGFAPNRRTFIHTHSASGSVAADFNDDGYIDLAVANHKVHGAHIAYSTVWTNGKNGFDESKTVNLTTSGPHGMTSTEPGNIMDRSFNEYYESVPHAIPAGEGVTAIYWDADIPAKCDVFAQLRVGDTLEELEKSPWLGSTMEGSRFRAHDFVDREFFNGKYMQYRLILYAFNGVETPRVRSVTVEFDKLGKFPKLF